MALVGVELESLVSEPDALTTRPPPCAVTQSHIDQVCVHVEQFRNFSTDGTEHF